MKDENGAWWVSVAPDGKENVTIGTPEFPVEMWGEWGAEDNRCFFVPCHWHPEMELNFITDGEEIVWADGKSVRLKPGQGVFVNGGVPHSSESARDLREHITGPCCFRLLSLAVLRAVYSGRNTLPHW